MATALGAVSMVAAVVSEPTTVTAAAGTITVNVYEDFNSNGVKDAAFGQTDVGLQGITVTGYCADGTTTAATTNGSGVATIAHTCADPIAPLDAAASHVRVEATWDTSLAPFAGLRPSHLGSGGTQPNGGTVQFVGGGAQTVNVALVRPSDYIGTNAELYTANYRAGTAGNDLSAEPSINSLPYAGGTVSDTTTRADTGTVWGTVYSRSRATVFSSAVVKRHTGLGPGGIDAIYSTPAAGGASTVVTNVGGAGSVPNDGVRGLGASTSPSQDASVYSTVGTVGLGDLELSDDETELWYTNLADGNLYRLPIGTPPAVTPGTPVSVGMGTATCTNGQLRPWAVKYQGGKVYVGAVCDASTDSVVLGSSNSNLTAHVFVYDPVGATWADAMPSFPLDFQRGEIQTGQPNTRRWYPWNDDWLTVYPGLADDSFLALPQPILADLEFDVNGVLVLGFIDRFGHQAGRQNYDPAATNSFLFSGWSAGDILRACWNYSTDTFVLESNGACGVVGAANRVTSAGASNGEGPGGGEFYFEESTANHGEVVAGGLAVLPGGGSLAMTMIDVNGVGWTQGVGWLDQNDGTYLRGTTIDTGTIVASMFGKASGLGDLEIMANEAPTEVGNRVWRDLDADGRQDAGEPGISGVVVTLTITAGGTYTATTDSNGQYGFSSRASGSGGGVTYNVPLGQGTAFTISVPTTTTVSSTTLSLTTRNAGGGSVTDPADAESRVSNADRIDSDVDTSTGQASSFTITMDGANQHSFDIGYYDPTVNLGNQVWFDLDDDGLKDVGEQPVAGVTLQLFWDGNNDGSLTTSGEQTVVQTATTDSQGRYLFSGLTSGNAYVVGVAPANFTGSGPLVGYHSSLRTLANDGSISETTAGDPDSDADDNDDNGTTATTGFYAGGVLSGAVVVTIGGEPTGESPNNNPSGTPDANSNLTVDFGFYRVAVGNQVWLDDGTGAGTADNGLLDGTEAGVDSVTVRLYASDGTTELEVGPDGWLGTTDDAPGGVSTVGGGFYQFQGLPEGSYVVVIDVPSGYRSSTDPTDGWAPLSTESDDNGVGAGTGTVVSEIFAMLPGSSSDGSVPNAADGTTANPRVDFGLVASSAPPTVVAVGDYTWVDIDQDGVQDGGESPLSGVTVRLFRSDATTGATDAQGNPVAPVVTDSLGHYVFDNLLPGSYVVAFTLPSGWVFTSTGGGVSADDSNPSPTADYTVGYTPIFTIAATASGDTRAVVSSDGALVASLIDPTIDAGVIDINAARLPFLTTTTSPAPNSSLATTGSDTPRMIAIAMLLVASGWIVLLARRRRPNISVTD